MSQPARPLVLVQKSHNSVEATAMVERGRQVIPAFNTFRLLRLAVEGANAVWVSSRQALARFRNDEDGMYLLSVTLTMPVLLGFVGLGSEAG
jgi:hypothetical protein